MFRSALSTSYATRRQTTAPTSISIHKSSASTIITSPIVFQCHSYAYPGLRKPIEPFSYLALHSSRLDDPNSKLLNSLSISAHTHPPVDLSTRPPCWYVYHAQHRHLKRTFVMASHRVQHALSCSWLTDRIVVLHRLSNSQQLTTIYELQSRQRLRRKSLEVRGHKGLHRMCCEQYRNWNVAPVKHCDQHVLNKSTNWALLHDLFSGISS